ncbi:MAG TPA: hypothetical protein VGP44_05210 [Gemmatimonadales bacterium]|nr:hypothetical protein [Gemmatimonadales bacterium]
MSTIRHKRDPQQKPNRPAYNVEMIRDFLDHLRWEVQINHFENTAAPGTINDELMAELQRYQVKYNLLGLLPTNALDASGVTEGEADQVFGIWRQVLAQTALEWLEHLEALDGLFKTAFRCIEAGSQPLTQVVKAEDFFE